MGTTRPGPEAVTILLLVAVPAYLTYEFASGGLPDGTLGLYAVAALTLAPGVLLGAVGLWVAAGG